MAKGEFILSIIALAVSALFMRYGWGMLASLLMWAGILAAVGAALVMLVIAAGFERLAKKIRR